MPNNPPPSQPPGYPPNAAPPQPPSGGGYPPPGGPGGPMMYPPPGPGPMYPPPMMMMPPPGMFKPQRSFTRMVFTTLAGTIFGLSLTLNLYLLLFSGIGGGLSRADGIERKVVVDGDLKEKVAVIPVKGIIRNETADEFEKMMDLAEKDAMVKAIVIEVDTPGGAVTPSDEIHARILRFRKQFPTRPVVVTMGSFATSGGYYVACAGEYIVAEPTTLTGNIGVLLPRYNVSKLAKSYGIEETTITAPRHGFKNAGSPLSPPDAKDDAYFQTLIDDAYANFKSAVTSGRGTKLNASIDEIADGRVYSASEALKAGLVDELNYASAAYDKAAALAKLTNKHVVRYSKPASLFDLFGGGGDSKATVPARSAGAAGGGSVTINGVNVNVDANLLDELSRPRLMYLWRGQ
jgi:protease-4